MRALTTSSVTEPDGAVLISAPMLRHTWAAVVAVVCISATTSTYPLAFCSVRSTSPSCANADASVPCAFASSACFCFAVSRSAAGAVGGGVGVGVRLAVGSAPSNWFFA